MAKWVFSASNICPVKIKEYKNFEILIGQNLDQSRGWTYIRGASTKIRFKYCSWYYLAVKIWTFRSPSEQIKKNSAKAPAPIYRLYFRRCLQKAQGSWNSNHFCIRKLKDYIFTSNITNFRIFSHSKYCQKSKLYAIPYSISRDTCRP